MRTLDLRALESRSWRTTQRDGLLDVFIGLVLLASAASSTLGELGTSDALRIGVTLALLALGILGFAFARRRLVLPRTGVASFGAERRRRVRGSRWILTTSVAVTLVLFAIFSALQVLPAADLRLLGVYGPSALVGGLVVATLGLLAFLLEVPRLVIHGVLFTGAEFALVTMERTTNIRTPGGIAFGVAAAVSLTIGLVVFIRFLRCVPIVPTIEGEE
jgi:hypothetical protein